MGEPLRFTTNEPFDDVTLSVFDSAGGPVVELGNRSEVVELSEAGLRWLVDVGGPALLVQLERARVR